MIDRRTILRGGLGAGLTFGRGPLSAQENPAALRPRIGDLLVRIDDATKTPLAVSDIPLAAKPVMAWAMDPNDATVRSGSRLNRVLLLRFDESALNGETKSRAAGGVVAYSAICTHTGCDVTDWLTDERVLSCACHFSKYNPRDSAMVIDGPAPRPLPALALKIDAGKLVVAAPFTARITFDPA